MKIEKEKLGNILRLVGDGMAQKRGDPSIWHIVSRQLMLSFLDEKTKASDRIAIAVYLRDTVEGKPKESISFSTEDSITPEMIEAKKAELEAAMLAAAARKALPNIKEGQQSQAPN